MTIADAHAHFFSAGFFRSLAAGDDDAAEALPRQLGWEPPGADQALADRWLAEIDRHHVARIMLIASAPGDEGSVAAARQRHPSRIVGAFMVNPGHEDAPQRTRTAFRDLGLSTACLFPAMHHVPVDSDASRAIFEEAAASGRAVFVHCGVLSIGVRKKLGLPCVFDLRLGDPLAVAAVAVRYPNVPVIIPHFGAGYFREALMAAGAAPNIHLDTSSSNAWTALSPGLSLKDVFDRALDTVGPRRLLFGTDSSFFPRGWQRQVFESQEAILTDLGVGAADQAAIFGGNFERLFSLAGSGPPAMRADA
jgi:predicted TIM-barrel fold metal-dependent hydrolase